MKSSLTTLYWLFCLASWTACSNSFVVNAFHQSKASQLGESESDGEKQKKQPPPGKPKNLVDTKTFVAAVKALQGTAGSEEESPMYGIGKIIISLSIAGQPGLDLAEAPGPMVLVSSVTGNAEEVGINPGDTIVSIGANNGGFSQETKGLSLEETATVLMSAANHAVENGLAEVDLEINRLIKLAYSD
jgi:hypothetical protein